MIIFGLVQNKNQSLERLILLLYNYYKIRKYNYKKEV